MPLSSARSLIVSLRVVLLALFLVVAFAIVHPATGAAKPRDPQRSPDDATRTVTLLTGDVVGWHRSATGEESAWIVKPARPAGSEPEPAIYQQDGQVHVVPAEAAPYLQSGRLDQNLFNITLLMEQGLDDGSTPTLPLMVQAEGGATARRAPATPTGAREVRTLTSIQTSSVKATKTEMRQVWESLRGRTIARYDSRSARLAGAGQVWLNTRVRTTLAESVPQIGAPEAWAAGYDGSGATVAVLDSGWDPHHPDLAGVVSETRNFTEEADPDGEVAVDQMGHGTHVAATVAGSGAASDGTRKGVAPEASLMIGKVIDKSGQGWSDDIIEAMEWAATSGADVINMSLGTDYASDGQDPMSQAVNVLTKETGALFVVAAGNAGPELGTVGSPGAADLALTVGAVDKQDKPASFSSRGPRIGDGAIKPEVVAPGVGIVAARAAGTSLGDLVDADYTSLNGTSMATPHVAGAAAILAGQHPDWSGAQLKARLASTAVPLDESVTFQGAGRIDVAAAIGTSVTTDAAALDLGAVPQDSDEVTRTLTYTNPTKRPVVLRLKAQLKGTGAAQQSAKINFADPVLRVPAGKSASTTISLDPRTTRAGGYAGQILAEVAGQQSAAIHTAASLVVDGPTRSLSIKTLDRAGKPATGSVDLWNADTGAWERLWLQDGAVETKVPEGTYSVLANFGTEPEGSFWLQDQTFAADPELQVTDDVAITYDARDGNQVKINTPRPADLSTYDALWSRTVGDRSFSIKVSGGHAGQEAYVIESPKASTGSFTFATEWQLEEPLLTVGVAGDDAGTVSPNPIFASTGDPYVGKKTLPLVDVGLGTPEDYATIDAKGKAVLVTRGEDMMSQAKEAKKAGAAVLFVANDRLDIWADTVWRQGQPTYRITKDAGDALRKALADQSDVTLDVEGIADSTYNYELAFASEGGLPADVTYDVVEDDLAVVKSDYRINSERMNRQEGWVPVFDSIGQGNIMSIRRNGAVKRTEYVSTKDVRWQRMAQPHGEFPNYYWTWTPTRQYVPGETTEQLFWGPLAHPAVVAGYGSTGSGSPVARFRDAIRVNLPHYSYGGGLWCTIYEQMGDRSEMTLRSDGEVLGKATWSSGQFTVPEGAANYQLELDVTNGQGNWSDTAVHTNSVWSFRSERTQDDRSVLPLVQVDYDVDTDGFNDVPADESSSLRLDPGYQPEASGPGEFTVKTEVSFDDGDTWAEAPVKDEDGLFEAKIPAAPDQADYASVRVTATDAAGNSLQQQIDRAWGISRS